LIAFDFIGHLRVLNFDVKITSVSLSLLSLPFDFLLIMMIEKKECDKDSQKNDELERLLL
jgi:hypothetical protein